MSNQKIDWGEKPQAGNIKIDPHAKSYGAEANDYKVSIGGWTCPVCRVEVTTIKDKKIHQIKCLGNKLKKRTTKRTSKKESNRIIRKNTQHHNYGVKSLDKHVSDGMATRKTIEKDGKTIIITTMGVTDSTSEPTKKILNMDKNLKSQRNKQILMNVTEFNAYKKRNRRK